MNETFRNRICDLLEVAVEQQDIDLVNTINDLFARMEVDGANYDKIDNESMVDFTAYLGTAIEKKIDENELNQFIENLRTQPAKAESYYDISYLV